MRRICICPFLLEQNALRWTTNAKRPTYPLDRCSARRRDGPHGHRSRARVCGSSARRTQSRRLLHALDHQFRRPRVRVSFRHIRVLPRPTSWKQARAVALPAHPRPDTRLTRAHGHSLRLDVQHRLRRIPPRRRDLDARLVHGADGRDHLAADGWDRGVWPGGDSSCTT